MAVTMLNRPYKVQVRPFRDSTEEVTIRWYRAPEGAKPLPFLSAIQPLLWATTPWVVDTVGEVYPVRKERASEAAPAGVTGQHWCGDPEDFLLGGRYLPDVPPVLYTEDGAMLCCLEKRGGVVWGGAAPTVPDPGAVVWAGVSPVLNPPFPAPEGGVVWGGTAPTAGYASEYTQQVGVVFTEYVRETPGVDKWVTVVPSTAFLLGPGETGVADYWEWWFNAAGLCKYRAFDWDGLSTATFTRFVGGCTPLTFTFFPTP